MPWTTKAEIESIWSALGVMLRLDDDDSGSNSVGENALLDDVIEEATETARRFLMHRYADAEVENNPWVRRRVSYLAAHYLSIRRGNPAQFETKAGQILRELQDVRQGREWVPDAAPLGDLGPSLSNLSVDWRYNRSQVRVDPQTATGGDGPDLDYDRVPPYTEPF